MGVHLLPQEESICIIIILISKPVAAGNTFVRFTGTAVRAQNEAALTVK